MPDSPSPAGQPAYPCDLQPLHTLHLRARARELCEISSTDELASLRRRMAVDPQPHLILGGGSNIVFTDDFPGRILRMTIRGRRLVGEDEHAWYVQAGAGENWHDFVRWTLSRGWAGLENLSLIPGTVGAAPVQNIGAYGLELATRFDRLEAYSLTTGEKTVLDAEACRFGYRDSVFKRPASASLLITAVTFRLPKRWQPMLAYAGLAEELATRTSGEIHPTDVSDAVIAVRQRKLPDPATLGNAGSFFKNPLVDAAALEALLAAHPAMPYYPQQDGTFKLAAGWLIEQCGWKGRRLGPAGCYERQALVLVNHGGACGADIRRLAEAIQRDVRQRFHVLLQPEPVFV